MYPLVLSLCLAACGSFALAGGPHFLTDKFIEGINSKQDLWQAGRNFAPSTPLSHIKILMGTNFEDSERQNVKTSDSQWPADDEIPETFDARKKWHKICPRIAEVLDQGICGSCWAIAAAQAFTDRYCIATKGKHQMRLSTARVLSCCGACGFGCHGGYPYEAWNYFSTIGLPSGGNWNTTEGCQPYNIQSPCKYKSDSPYRRCTILGETPPCLSHCTNTQYGKELSKDYRFGKSAYKLMHDERAIMKEIMTHGPVTMSFVTYQDFMSYKRGVYQPTLGARPIGGHAVKVIGWGVENGIPYWLIMNSWNEFWGDHGLVKMRRNHQQINVEEKCYAAVPDTTKNYISN